jgi:hypothetical protein
MNIGASFGPEEKQYGLDPKMAVTSENDHEKISFTGSSSRFGGCGGEPSRSGAELQQSANRLWWIVVAGVRGLVLGMRRHTQRQQYELHARPALGT